MQEQKEGDERAIITAQQSKRNKRDTGNHSLFLFKIRFFKNYFNFTQKF